MTPVDHLAAIVDGLPDGAVVTIRADWVRALLAAQPPVAPPVPVDLTIADAARALGRSPQRVRDWYRMGRFPNAWLLGREIRIPRADIEAVGCAAKGRDA